MKERLRLFYSNICCLDRIIVAGAFFTAFSFLSFTSNSQTNFFQKTIGGNNDDEGYAVQQTTDGGFISMGFTKSYGAGNSDFYLVKTSVNGNVIWTKMFGGNDEEECYSGQQTADGGYIMTGYTKSFGNGEEVLLVKTDNAGNLQWTKRYGGTNDERGYYVEQTSDLGYIITGYTKSGFSAGAEDIYLIKTDASGNLQWANAYGDNNKEFGYSVHQTNSGMYIVTGSTESFGAGQEDLFLLKTNGAGTLIYFKTFGGGNQDYGYSIRQLSNGKYLIGGSTRSFGAGGDDAFVVNTDTLGLLQFAKTYGGGNNDYAYELRETSTGQFIIAGLEKSFSGGAGNGYLIKTNNTGGIIWSKSYGGGNAEQTNSVYQMSNGQFVLLGHTRTFGVGANDFYLLRTDTAGTTGCNESNPATIVNTPAIVTGNFTPIVSPGGVINTPAVVTTSNFDLTTLLCQCIAPPNITGDAIICPGQTSTLSVSGGTSYSWSTGSTSTLITVSPSVTTSYSVLVSNGVCSDTASFKVTVSSPPAINITPSSATICSGGSVLLTASGASVYAWSPVTGLSCGSCPSPTANPLSTTLYTVTGTDVNGCTNTQTTNVTTVPLPTVTVNPGIPIICIGSSVTFTAAGASNYGWSPSTGLSCNNCPNPSASPTINSTYTVIGTATTGCTDTHTVTVTVNALPVLTVSPSSATLCAGNSTIFSASGANNYTWSPSTGLSCTNCPSPNSNATITTIYTVTGTDMNGCSNTITATLVINPLPALVINPSAPSICAGSSTIINASGASSYSWSPSTGLSCTNCPSPTANPAVSTAYTLSGTGSNGCIDSKSFTVTVNSLPAISITPATATICSGNSTILNAGGANTYAWSQPAGLSCTNCASPVANPTITTTYTITGTDINGCINTNTTSVTVNSLPVITVSPAAFTLCAGSSAALTASGAVNYTWSPATALSCTSCPSPTFSPLVNTVYTVTGTNANGCVNTQTTSITVNPLPSINVNPSSATICAGSSVLLSASGASSYSWLPATGLNCTACSSPTANPSANTIYTVTGTDINGCSNTQTTSVSTNSLPVISVSPASPSVCAGNFIVLTASGASSYGWSPATALSCNNCANPSANPGVNTSYTVTGTDVNGCVNTKTLTVFVNPLPSITISPPSATFCTGGSTIFSASGANSYTWIPSTGLSCTNCANPSANPTITTTYTVSGTDLNGCSNTNTATITVDQFPVLVISPASPTICTGSSTVLTASGATTYSWLPSAGLSCTNCPNPTANPTSSSVYTLTGSNGACVNSKTISVNVNPLPVITVNPVSATLCAGSSTLLSASGTNSYSWAPSGSLNCATCATTTSTPGTTTTYTVTGTDVSGCSNTNTVTVVINPLPVLTISPSSPTVCAGSSAGLAVSGAVNYTWTPATALSCTTCANPTANPTVTTTYTVTGINANGCINTKTVTVSVNSLPVINVSAASITLCAGISTVLSASGASGYTWSPATAMTCTNCANATINPTVSTIYTVTGTDVNGCTNFNSVSVTINPLPVVNISPVSVTLCTGGSAGLSASGANSYSWTPSSGLSCNNCPNPTAAPGTTTSYTVTGTDNNGCVNTKTISVQVNPLPVINISPSSVTACAGSSVALSASGANTYSWIPSQGISCTACSNPIATPTTSTIYTVTGTDASGCSNTGTASINVNTLPVLTLTPVSATLCTGSSVTFNISGANSYVWSPVTGLSCSGCSNPTANPSVSTIYTITGTDLNGCISTVTASIIINSLPVISIAPSSATLCAGNSVSLTAAGANNYTWMPSTGLSCTNCANTAANPGISTIYTVTGSNINGCVNTKTILITVNPLPVVTINPGTSTICVGGTTGITASGANSYVWSPSSGLSCTTCSNVTANPGISTSYTITGTDNNGCMSTATTTVYVNSLPAIVISPAASTICIGNSALLTASGANSYVWSPITGLSCSGCSNPSASPTITTNYTVTGTDVNGCVNTNTTSVTVNPLPGLTINPASPSICIGGSVALSASGANNYTWSPATALSCTNCVNTTANPTVSTTYTVTGNNTNGCPNTVTVSVTVNPLPIITLSPATATLCAGNSTAITASGANSYTWLPNSGLSCNTCNSPTVSPSITTSYTVNGTDVNGCVNSITTTVFISPLPIINVNPSSVTLCIGSSTVLNASGAITYVWAPFSGINCNNCPSPITNPTVSTTYTVTGTGVNGCVNTVTANVTVNPLPSISITPPAATLCVGAGTVLNAAGANAYTWTPATALSCTNCAGPSASPSVTTTYTVSGINANGCVNTKTVLITVNPLPVISITPASATICAGSSTSLTASGANSYIWTPSSGLSCNNCTGPIAMPTVNTTYSITGTDINGCVNSATASIVVNPLPLITINPSSATLCLGTSTVLTASGGTGYSWSPFSGLSCNNCSNPTANPTVTTVYTVTGTDANGCSDTETVSVVISSSLALIVNPVSATLCSGGSTVLTASGATGYLWTPSSGLSCNSCANPTASPSVTTIYMITGTAASGCVGTKTVIININSLPVINLSPASGTICTGNSVNFSATGANSYTWSPSTALSCTNCPNPVANPTNNITYSIIGTDFNGCVNTKTTSVIVNPLPVISISSNPSSGSICIGSSATLTASGPNSYTWSPVTALSCINCSIPVATPTNNTTYTVAGTDGNGCTNTKTISVVVNPLPVINVNPVTSTICAGYSVALNATGGSSYTWSPVNGLSCTNCVSPIATPPSSIIYSVTGNNTNGCVNTTTVSVTVNTIPIVNVSQSSATICAGGSTVFSASGAGNYTWTPSAGLSCSTCPSPTANPSSSTVYTVTGENANGCVNTNTVEIIINQLPAITINPPSAILCAGNSVSLTASGSNSYAWSPLTGLNCGNCSSVTANPGVTTNYTITGYNTTGCSNTITVPVVVNPLPNLLFYPPASTLCIGSTTIVTVTGANTYTWSTSSGLSCNICNNPAVSPTVTTTYSVTGKDANGCLNSKQYSVVVGQPINANITGDSVVCAGSNLILQATGGTEYNWSNGAITASTVVNPITVTTFSVIVSKLGCKDTVLKTVSVYSVPVADAGPDMTINYGSSVILNGTGGGLYSWSPPEGLSCTNCANPIANPTVTTLYNLTVTNNLGCTNSDPMNVFIEYICGDVFVPNVFSPNGDNQNDVLYVENRCLESIEFLIYDRWGEKVFETNDPKQGWDGSYKGSPMNGGGFVYYLRARLVNQDEIIVKKGNILILR